ncbi:MAG: DUF6063 family protein [Oscillospiraceae bacterium]
MNINIVGNAIRILLENGQLSLKMNRDLYREISLNWDTFNQLSEMCNTMGLYVVNYNESYYISPMPRSKTFSYSNEELRKELGSQFNNTDLYLVLMIMAIFITEVCPNGEEIGQSLITLNEFISVVEKKFEYFNSLKNVEKLSKENSYNIDECLKRWNELLAVNRNQDNEIIEKGKNSRYQICLTTLKFMEKHRLIKLGGVNGKTIYIQDRFKAMVSNTYNSNYIQNQIFEIIKNAGGEIYG